MRPATGGKAREVAAVASRVVGLLVRGAAGSARSARVLHRAQARVVGHRRRHQADEREKRHRGSGKELPQGQGFDNFAVRPEHSQLVPSGLVIGTSPQAGSLVPPSTTSPSSEQRRPVGRGTESLSGQRCGNADNFAQGEELRPHERPPEQQHRGHRLRHLHQAQVGHSASGGEHCQLYCSAGRATTTSPVFRALNRPRRGRPSLGAAEGWQHRAGPRAPPSQCRPGGLQPAVRRQPDGRGRPRSNCSSLTAPTDRYGTFPPALVGRGEGLQAQNPLGLGGNFTTTPVSEATQDGIVPSQNPGPDTPVNKGSTVNVIIGRSPQVRPPQRNDYHVDHDVTADVGRGQGRAGVTSMAGKSAADVAAASRPRWPGPPWLHHDVSPTTCDWDDDRHDVGDVSDDTPPTTFGLLQCRQSAVHPPWGWGDHDRHRARASSRYPDGSCGPFARLSKPCS